VVVVLGVTEAVVVSEGDTEAEIDDVTELELDTEAVAVDVVEGETEAAVVSETELDTDTEAVEVELTDAVEVGESEGKIPLEVVDG